MNGLGISGYNTFQAHTKPQVQYSTYHKLSVVVQTCNPNTPVVNAGIGEAEGHFNYGVILGSA